MTNYGIINLVVDQNSAFHFLYLHFDFFTIFTVVKDDTSNFSYQNRLLEQ